MLTLLPPPTWAEIQAKIEDLPPPIAAFGLRYLRDAQTTDHALILADALDEGAREYENIVQGQTLPTIFRQLAATMRAAAPLLDRRNAA